MQFKLANVVLKVEKHAIDFPELYYRVLSGDALYDDDIHSLHVNGHVDFLTYVNGLSAGKWHQYASVDSVVLHLALFGRGRVVVHGVRSGELNPVELKSNPFVGDRVDPCVLDIDIDTVGYDLIGFRIESDGGNSVDLLNASYLTDVPEDSINPINLALSTTTFKNEQYILPNIELV